jgi:hypothetical protein
VLRQQEPDGWYTFDLQWRLGACLLGQGKLADAEPLLLGGYEGLKEREAKLPAGQRHYPADALEGVIRLYEARGDRERADAWRKKRDEAARRP